MLSSVCEDRTADRYALNRATIIAERKIGEGETEVSAFYFTRMASSFGEKFF